MREGVGWPRRRKGQDLDSAACNPPTASLCSTQLLDCAVHTLKNYCTLHSLDAVDARLSLPSTDHPVVGGEEHVLGPPHRHPVHRQLVCAAVPDQPSVTGRFFMFWWRSWFFMLFEFLLKPRVSHLSNITFSSAAVTCNREVDERLMMQEKDKKDRSGHWLLGVKGWNSEWHAMDLQFVKCGSHWTAESAM